MNSVAPVTVAMPVYNGEQFFPHALAAIQRQEFTDFEVLIRDNASTDATEEIAREYARTDDRFRYVRNEQNIGGARNSNAILADARSPFIIWAYHDDEAHPALIKDSMAVLSAIGPSAVAAFPRVQLINESGEVVGRHEDADLDILHDEPHLRLKVVLQRVVGQVQFGLMRTDAVRASGGVTVSTGGEMILPAALALRGKLPLSSAEGARLSIRQHAERSGGDRESEAAWIDPDRPNVPFPYSRSSALLFDAIRRAGLSPAERRRARRTVLWNWTRPGLRSIAGDLARLPWDAGWLKRR